MLLTHTARAWWGWLPQALCGLGVLSSAPLSRLACASPQEDAPVERVEALCQSLLAREAAADAWPEVLLYARRQGLEQELALRLERALEAEPANDFLRALAARLRMRSGEREQAFRLLRDGSLSSDAIADCIAGWMEDRHNLRGQAAAELQALLETAVKQRPSESRWRKLRAESALELEQWSLALSDYEALFASAEIDSEEWIYDAIQSLARAEQWSSALHFAARAGDPLRVVNSIHWLDPARTIEFLRQRVAASSAQPELRLELAHLLEQNGELAEALQHLRLVLAQTSPDARGRNGSFWLEAAKSALSLVWQLPDRMAAFVLLYECCQFEGLVAAARQTPSFLDSWEDSNRTALISAARCLAFGHAALSYADAGTPQCADPRAFLADLEHFEDQADHYPLPDDAQPAQWKKRLAGLRYRIYLNEPTLARERLSALQALGAAASPAQVAECYWLTMHAGLQELLQLEQEQALASCRTEPACLALQIEQALWAGDGSGALSQLDSLEQMLEQRASHEPAPLTLTALRELRLRMLYAHATKLIGEREQRFAHESCAPTAEDAPWMVLQPTTEWVASRRARAWALRGESDLALAALHDLRPDAEAGLEHWLNYAEALQHAGLRSALDVTLAVVLERECELQAEPWLPWAEAVWFRTCQRRIARLEHLRGNYLEAYERERTLPLGGPAQLLGDVQAYAWLLAFYRAHYEAAKVALLNAPTDPDVQRTLQHWALRLCEVSLAQGERDAEFAREVGQLPNANAALLDLAAALAEQSADYELALALHLASLEQKLRTSAGSTPAYSAYLAWPRPLPARDESSTWSRYTELIDPASSAHNALALLRMHVQLQRRIPAECERELVRWLAALPLVERRLWYTRLGNLTLGAECAGLCERMAQADPMEIAPARLWWWATLAQGDADAARRVLVALTDRTFEDGIRARRFLSRAEAEFEAKYGRAISADGPSAR